MIANGLPPFQVTYDEGLNVGYKWYDAKQKEVLFSFGYGLSYTTYTYSNLKVTPEKSIRGGLQLANTGARAGAEIAEIYAVLPASAGEPPKRLVGWSKVTLDRGETKDVTIEVDPEDQFLVTPVGHVFGMYAPHQGGQGVRALFSSPSVHYDRDGKPASFWGLKGSASLRDKDLTLTVVNPHVTDPRETEIVIHGAAAKPVTSPH